MKKNETVYCGDGKLVFTDGVLTSNETVTEYPRVTLGGPPPTLEDQIRQIVREEIAAQKEQLFVEINGEAVALALGKHLKKDRMFRDDHPTVFDTQPTL